MLEMSPKNVGAEVTLNKLNKSSGKKEAPPPKTKISIGFDGRLIIHDEINHKVVPTPTNLITEDNESTIISEMHR